MAYNSNTGIITAPVSIRDVQQAVGSNNRDLGTLITNGYINKWARYKPVISANKAGRLTYEDFSNAKFGLTPQLNSLLKSKSDMSSGSTVVSDADELAEVMEANKEWVYQRPGGGWASPFRLTDFYAPADNDSLYGYYRDTPAAVENVNNMSVKMSDIIACINNGNISITPKTSESYEDWIVNEGSSQAPYYTGLTFRYGEGTNQNINGADTRVIILQDILGMQTSDSWRLGVAVQVPSGSSLSYMRFFVSKNTFYQAQSVSNAATMLLPSLSTSQFLCQKILDYCNYLYNNSVSNDVIGNRHLTGSNPSFALPACLCITKEMYISMDNNLTHCMPKSGSYLYSTPSEMTKLVINVVDDYHFSQSEILAYDYVSISSQMTEQYAQFGEETYTRVYIFNLMLEQKVKVSATVEYTVQFTYVSGFNGTTPIVQTQTISNSVVLNSSELKTINLYAAPGLTITQKVQTLV